MKPTVLLPLFLLLIGSAISDRAFAQDPESRGIIAGRLGNIDLDAPALAAWPECATLLVHDHAQSLCTGSDEKIGYGAYEILLGLLRAGTVDRAALCLIDQSLVLSEKNCLKPEFGGFEYRSDGLQLGNLMEGVARNWHRLGAPQRADQLYARMHAMFDRDLFLRSISISVMRDWALMKVAQGRLEEATRLAALRTALAREVAMCQEMPRWALIDSLRFEAGMLEAAGNADRALPLRREADKLSVIPPDACDPCLLTPPAIPPGGRCQ